MVFQTGNRMFSSSAGQPAHYSQHSTAQRLARGLPTGWGNDHEYRPDDHSAQQPGQHSHRSSAKPPAGELSMASGVSLKWTTCPSKWNDSSQIYATHLHAAPRMQAFATTRTTLREIPWRRILEHLLTTAATRMDIPFDAPKLLSEVVEAAGVSTLEDLALYLRNWRAVSERVRAVLDWQISPQEMCERNRPGAWLADCMITELKVREQGSRSSVHYEAVGNGEYKIIAHKIGIAQECATNSSANNVGNQLECLCWVAFEEDRPEWIIALVWHALQLELTWCSRKKFKSSAAVTAATEAEESFLIRSDLHPAHETQAATWEERSHIPALTALEANVSPAGAVPSFGSTSDAPESPEDLPPATSEMVKVEDLEYQKHLIGPRGISLTLDDWKKCLQECPGVCRVTEKVNKDGTSTKSKGGHHHCDYELEVFFDDLSDRYFATMGLTMHGGALHTYCRESKKELGNRAAKAFRTACQKLDILVETSTRRGHHPQRPPPRAEPSAPSSSSTAKPPPPDAKLPTGITSISRSTQAASRAESPSASSATVIMPRESDSDAHPVREPESAARSSSQPPPHSDGHPAKSTLTTPLWDAFLEILQSVSDEENRRDFANFIQHHCFREDHFFKDSHGHIVDTIIPLSVKMESLFQTAWHRRKLALERLRQNGVTINDETYELNDNDMKTLPQLRLPGRHLLIVCEWD